MWPLCETQNNPNIKVERYNVSHERTHQINNYHVAGWWCTLSIKSSYVNMTKTLNQRFHGKNMQVPSIRKLLASLQQSYYMHHKYFTVLNVLTSGFSGCTSGHIHVFSALNAAGSNCDWGTYTLCHTSSIQTTARSLHNNFNTSNLTPWYSCSWPKRYYTT